MARRCTGITRTCSTKFPSTHGDSLSFSGTDNIPEEPSKNPGQDNWRVRIAMARLWRDAVNRLGGDVTLVHLPDLGIHCNTHFPFSDLNNLEIAGLLSKYLEEKGLD